MPQPLTPMSSRNIDLDKMFDPKDWGWRFVAFDLRMPNGQLVEFYMPFQELEQAKKDGNHALFDKWRDTTKAEKWERKNMKQTFSKAIDSMTKHGKEPLIDWGSRTSIGTWEIPSIFT